MSSLHMGQSKHSSPLGTKGQLVIPISLMHELYSKQSLLSCESKTTSCCPANATASIQRNGNNRLSLFIQEHLLLQIWNFRNFTLALSFSNF